MGMAILFENMRVYEKSMRLADEIDQLMPKRSKGNAYLIDQLQRAAMSIPANLAEASGRRYFNERRYFLGIARGSACECIAHLRFAVSRRLIAPTLYPKLRSDLELITKMITSWIARPGGTTSPSSKKPGLRQLR